MAHPFQKIFERALKKSTPDENLVQKEALKLIEKGYSTEEVRGVLNKLQKSLIDEKDEAIVREALEELFDEDDI